MRTFALRTKDAQWAAAMGGYVDAQGFARVPVHEAALQRITFCGKPWYRHAFARPPRDAVVNSGAIMCPAVWMD